MTKKELLRFEEVEHMNEMLTEQIAKQLRITGDLIAENVLLKARIATISAVMQWPIGHEHEK